MFDIVNMTGPRIPEQTIPVCLLGVSRLGYFRGGPTLNVTVVFHVLGAGLNKKKKMRREPVFIFTRFMTPCTMWPATGPPASSLLSVP